MRLQGWELGDGDGWQGLGWALAGQSSLPSSVSLPLFLSPFPEKNLLDPDHADNHTAFKNWLQCYGVPGMSSLRDHNGRTIWFQVGWGSLPGAGCPYHPLRGTPAQLLLLVTPPRGAVSPGSSLSSSPLCWRCLGSDGSPVTALSPSLQGEPGPMAPKGECPLLPAGPAPALGGLEEEENHSQALLGRQLLQLLGHSGLWHWGMQPALPLASSQHPLGAFPGLQPHPALTRGWWEGRGSPPESFLQPPLPERSQPPPPSPQPQPHLLVQVRSPARSALAQRQTLMLRPLR